MKMARSENATSSAQITITVSSQTAQLLEDIAAEGHYGRTRAVVAAGFVERRLHDLIESGSLEKILKQKRTKKQENG
jgi:hypothetical protein